MSAIVTMSGHVLSARKFLNTPLYYYKLGNDAAWTTEPEAPDERSDVTNLVGFKRVERLAYVVPDAAGLIQYRGKSYSEVPENEIFTKEAHYVMLTADIQEGDFPLGTEYNQLVLSTDVVPKAGFEDNFTLMPNQVDDAGKSILVDFRRTVIIDESSRVHLSLIMEF